MALLGMLDCSHHFVLVTDGDLLVLISRMLDLRGRDTVRIAKVTGHADEAMVLDGRGWVTALLMRLLTLVGRRVGPAVFDARRNLSGVCGRYPVILDLHRLFIAISWGRC